MTHKYVDISGSAISTWDGFHDHFQDRFGFPEFYGRNLDAWIDCMTSLDAPEDGLSQVHVTEGALVILCVKDARDLKTRNAEIFAALNEATAFVNHRRITDGDGPILALSYHA